jgi:hypothetical protein
MSSGLSQEKPLSNIRRKAEADNTCPWRDIKACNLARFSVNLLPDDSLNYDDYCHNFRLMMGVTSSLTILSMILGLGYTRKEVVASIDRDEGPLSIENYEAMTIITACFNASQVLRG